MHMDDQREGVMFLYDECGWRHTRDTKGEGPMILWVDADATPRPVRDIIFRASLRLELETVLVANHRIGLPANNEHVRFVLVEHGFDVADHHIAAEAEAGDVTITADIPLAADLVDKDVHVISPRGEIYDRENIRERLSVRDFMDSLRSTGVETGGPSAFGNREKQAFASALDRTLTKALRKARRTSRPSNSE